jgi:prepilin signal peptidase PulO-like enzyme (type II secretory pathway)
MLTRLTGGQIGAGDGIILCLIGVMYPAEDVSVILMAALFLAAAYSGILLVRRHRTEESYAFVPFLFAGTVLVAVTGRMTAP